jgi:hypothetical protein
MHNKNFDINNTIDTAGLAKQSTTEGIEVKDLTISKLTARCCMTLTI